MAIRRLIKSADLDDMPPAKLYLDDIKDIVEILVDPGSDASSEPSVVKYEVRGRECDTLEDLEKLGGRAGRFEIRVSRGYRTSTVRSTGRGTSLWIAAPENDFWNKHGRVRRIFENNAIWWKSVLNKCFGRFSFVIGFPIFLFVLNLVSWHFTSSSEWRKTEDELYGLEVWLWVAFMFIYTFAFAGSTAVFRYSHTKGWGRWFEAHGSQILLVVLGVVLKVLGDVLWRYFQRH